MASSSPFQNITINDLSEFSFIGGTQQYLIFDVYDTAGSPISLNASTCTWVMSPYGQPNYVSLTKNAVISSSPSNRFTVTLSTTETKSLSGRFIHQPIIRNTYDSSEYRPSQGSLVIIPAITP